jgi:hypothetical protein
MLDRVKQIDRCMREIENCLIQIKRGNHDMAGPWLGYMDWLEELHYQIHAV